MVNQVGNIIFTDNLDEISQEIFGSENKYCLVTCMNGRMQLTQENEVVNIEANEMVIMKTENFSKHFMRTPDFSGCLLSVDNKMVQELMIEICRVEPRWWEVTKKLQSNPVFRMDNEKHKKLMETYFSLLKQYLEGNQNEYRKRTYMLLAKAAAYEVLAILNKEMSVDDTAETFTAADRIAKSFINDLKNDDGTHREVAWYAARLNITPKYLSHICKDKLKMTASVLIQEVTCDRIKYYLLRTDMNIKEIAYKLKFPTVSFFCKYVRQHMNMSPLELRRKGGI